MSSTPALILAAVVVIAAPCAAAERDDYILHCAGCHKLDGSGSEVVPALAEVGRIYAIPGGREYLARVPGAAQAPLSSERLAALLNWLLAEHGQTRAEPPYVGEEVERLRARPLRDPVAERNRLLATE